MQRVQNGAQTVREYNYHKAERAASRTRWTTWTRVSASVYGGIA